MLDDKTMAMLSAIPADQHDLPPELQDAAAGLANLIALDCPGEATGSAVNPFEALMAGGRTGDAAPPAADPAALPPVPRSAPAGNLTAGDIAAAPVGGDTPPPARPADPTAPASADDGSLAAVSPAAAPVAVENALPAESSTNEVLILVLAVAMAGGIAVAGYFLQRSLRRGR